MKFLKKLHDLIMELVTNIKGKKALLVQAGGGTCAIAEGIAKEDLIALREDLKASNADFAKRHGMTQAEFDGMTNEDLWKRAAG
jgi:hypothetical protein